jgi:hypothetical protein
MKRFFFVWLIYAIFTDILNAQISINHSFACTDYSRGEVCIISDIGKLIWQYPAEQCNDLWVLPDVKITHAFEITRDKKLVWIYNDQSILKTMSSIQILDSKGKPLKGKVLH